MKTRVSLKYFVTDCGYLWRVITFNQLSREILVICYFERPYTTKLRSGALTKCKILKESNMPFLRYCFRKIVSVDWLKALWAITGDQTFLRYSFCVRTFRYIKINLLRKLQIFYQKSIDHHLKKHLSGLIWSMMISCTTNHLLILFMED